MTTTNDHGQPAALSAFLSAPSRILNVDAASAKKAAVAPAPVNKLSPEQISLKIASMLKPGPPFYSTVSSADLIDNLGSASIMRCDELQPGFKKAKVSTAKAWLKGGIAHVEQTDAAPAENETWAGVGTVWSALNGLPSGAAAFEIPSSHQDGTELSTAGVAGDDDGLWSSIMFACDLDGSNVELTKSCVVPTKVLTEAHYFKGNYNALFTTLGAGKTYRWDDWSAHATATSNQTTLSSMLTLYTMPSVEMWSWPAWMPYLGQKEGVSKPIAPSTPLSPNQGGSKRVWVPSTTKVSVHASWWGYTIYLPSAVLPALEADVDQAEKIAGIVHVVLTTILDKAGSLPLPAALQAAVLLLKAIAPSTSYIATFIGWSWDSIKSFDKGQGVELTATWLLPIALIPHSWDAAIAPADKNGDGTPDGPPSQPGAVPAAPAAPAPSGEDSDQAQQPDTAAPATPAPAEPEEPVDAPIAVEPVEPIATAPTTEQPATSDAETLPEEADQPASEEPEATEQDATEVEAHNPEVSAESSEYSKPVQSLLTLAPEAADGESLSEEAIQEFAKTPEAATIGQSNAIAEEEEEEEGEEEEEKEEETKEEEKEEEKEEVKEEVREKPAAAKVEEEAKEEETAETVQPTTKPDTADTDEPNAPADSIGDANQGDPLGLGKENLPSTGDVAAPTPAPENDGIEWQGQSAAGGTTKLNSEAENAMPAPTSPTGSTRKLQLKGGARKLFGKMTNKA